MAIRMQQRRGTAAQWTSANPILGSGEIGYETDTGEFRVGDGVTAWSGLSPFKNILDLGGNLDDYIPLTFIGANDGVAALTSTGQVDGAQLVDFGQSIVTLISNTHSDITTEITNAVAAKESAITNAYTADIATAKSQAINIAATDATTKANAAQADAATDATTKANAAQSAAETTASGYVSTHAADTTDVHGISDTSALATKNGIEILTNKTISAADNTVTINLSDVVDVTASVAEVNKLAGLTTTKTELGYVNGVTSAIQTQLNAKAPSNAPALTGNATAENLTISGNLTVNGTTTTVSSANLELTDSLIYLASQQYSADAVDIGVYGAYGAAGNTSGNHPHTGLVRDASDSGKWKLISGGSEPTSNVVDFTSVTYDTLKLGGVEFSDGTQVKQGVPSITTINQQAGAYTTVLADRDKLVEISSASGVTVTIPTNASVAYPVGTSIDILQTGAGQVTIAGAGGVTVNATPGLKLRTQWSSATLFKRATDTWVVFGDLSA